MNTRNKVVLTSIAAVILLTRLGVGLALTVGSSRAQNIRACSNRIFQAAKLPDSVRKNICKCEYEYVEWLGERAGLFSIEYDELYRRWRLDGGRVGPSAYALCTPPTVPSYLR